MRRDSTKKSILFTLSFLLHAFIVAAIFLSIHRSQNTLWSGGKSGSAEPLFITVSGNSSETSVPQTIPAPREKKAPQIIPVPQAKPQPTLKPKTTAQNKTSPSQQTAPQTGGRGASSTPAGGIGNGIDATGAVSANAPNILAKIRARILAKQKYPSEARKNGISGTVKVSIKIASDGSLDSVRVVKTSGYSVLDDAAVAAVRSAAPLPYFPQTIALPLEYRLK